MSHARSLIRFAVLAGCLGFLPGCGNDGDSTANPPGGSSLVIHGAGSTFAAPLYKTWADEFHKVRPDIAIDYASVGSGEGQKRFVDDTVDFSGAPFRWLASESMSSRWMLELSDRLSAGS